MKKNYFQQSDFWCDFKVNHGWKCIKVENLNILTRTFKKSFLSFSIAYVPMAPFFEENENTENYVKKLNELSKKIKSFLPKNCLFLRFDLPIDFYSLEERSSFVKEVESISKKYSLPIKKSNVDVQPPDSTFLDLSLEIDELLSKMKNKWRYNIRYAEKHGVTVRKIDKSSADFENSLDSFYELYKTTASRDGIGLHAKDYYKDLLLKSDEKSTVNLYIASHENEDLAGIITLFQNDESVYLYGASSNNKRNLMPAYLVQMTAIKDAKQFGAKTYDFYGIPPVADAKHPMHGLYLFKTGFGGKIIHRPGCFDIPLSCLYSFYKFMENTRAFVYKKLFKKLRGR